ncbi:MAG: DUF1854 domain-containing protein [Gemmatimonadetes bacterium]|nr:DUF1854 domain-containing protein [Gemmatimonadota bacterium]NIO32764.1 DUF1854 domain-containing protein [Gemmatimonadota bacterium]
MKATVYAKTLLEDSQAELTLERRADGRLWAVKGSEERPVWVRRCFPWSQPARYISLRDSEESEFALVNRLGELSVESRAILEEALVEAGFVLKIVRVLDLDEEVEIRNWKVETEQGPRSFQTRLDDWPRRMPGGGILIRDVAGDLYHVDQPGELDARSRGLLWVFID